MVLREEAEEMEGSASGMASRFLRRVRMSWTIFQSSSAASLLQPGHQHRTKEQGEQGGCLSEDLGTMVLDAEAGIV